MCPVTVSNDNVVMGSCQELYSCSISSRLILHMIMALKCKRHMIDLPKIIHSKLYKSVDIMYVASLEKWPSVQSDTGTFHNFCNNLIIGRVKNLNLVDA